MRRRRRAPATASGTDPADGTAEGAPGETASKPRTNFDEGVELLHAALAQVRGHEPAADESTTTAEDGPTPARARRAGNGNGRGATAEAPAVGPDVDDAEGLDDAEELDREPGDARTRQRERAEQRERRSHRRARRAAAPSPDVQDDAETPATLEAATETDASAPQPAGAPEPASEPEPRVSLEPVVAETAAQPSVARRVANPRAPLHSRRRERIVVALVVALVLAVTGGLALATLRDGGSGGGAPATVSRAELTFDTISLDAGATAERTWTLRGRDGDRFVGELTFANSTDEPLTVSHTEVIPKSLARSVDDIEFDPDPVVIDPDPVVEFDLTVPADETVTATYRIDVAPLGADESRLEDWADDMETELERRATTDTTTATTTTTTTTTTPEPGEPTGDEVPAPTAAPPAPSAAPAPPPPPPSTGTIVIAVRSIGGETGTFPFGGPNGNVNLSSGQSAAMSVNPGGWVWYQSAVPAGWRFEGVSCSNSRSTIDNKNRRAVFDVQAGETVVCTWTNRWVG